ncbi:MAG TPA: hypothetical protein VHR15_16805 [Ktedonobacterales bacterium]|nr:hypothetical protein [Ktedonobacterales bacterium]
MIEHDTMLEVAHPCGKLQIEGISQLAQPPEERLLIQSQRVVAPLDGRVQTMLAGGSRALAVDEEMVCALQLRIELLHRQDIEAACG